MCVCVLVPACVCPWCTGGSLLSTFQESVLPAVLRQVSCFGPFPVLWASRPTASSWFSCPHKTAGTELRGAGFCLLIHQFLKRTDPDGSPFPSILVRRLWQSRKLTPCQVLLKSFSMYSPCVRTLTGAQRSENNLGSWFCPCTRGSRNWTRNVRLPSKPFTHWITLLSQVSPEDKSMNQRNRISITQLCYTTGPSTFEMHERAE